MSKRLILFFDKGLWKKKIALNLCGYAVYSKKKRI